MTLTERDTWPDDVRRVKDEMDMHAVAGARGWVAFHLADGRPLDHTAYPVRILAVKAAKWDRDNYMYAEIQPDGMPYREASAVLKYARSLHEAGWRIPDPEFDYDASMPRTAADRKRMARQLVSGKPLSPQHITTNLPSEGARIPVPYRKAQ